MVGGGGGRGNEGRRGPSVQSPCPPPASPRIRAAPCPPYRGGAGGPRAWLGHGARCRCGRGATGGGAEQRRCRAARPVPPLPAGPGGPGQGVPARSSNAGEACVVWLLLRLGAGRGSVDTFQLSSGVTDSFTAFSVEGLFSHSLGKAFGFRQS